MKHKLAIGAASVALVAGGGGAYAATRSNAPTRDQFLNDVAARLGTTRAKLDAALKGAASDQLAKSVAAGRLTQAQANDIKKRLQQGGAAPFLYPRLIGPPGILRIGGRAFVNLDAAAKYLGMTQAQLAKQLRSGKSLADVAKAQGKSVSGLEQAVRAAMRARLDRAVKDGRLTSAQRDKMLKALDQAVDRLVKRPPPRGPRPLIPPP